MKINIKTIGTNILVSLVTLLICLYVIERILGHFYPAPVLIPIRDKQSGYHELVPDKKLIYVPVPFRDGKNSDGHEDREHKLEKSSGTTRIVFMGDSVVNTLDVDFDKGITELLGQKLGPGYEIINMAVDGYNLVQEIEYYKLRGSKYNPDYVFFGITHNDLEVHSGEVDDFDRLIKNANMDFFYQKQYELKKDIIIPLSGLHTYRYFYFFTRRNRAALARGDVSFADSVFYRLDNDDTRTILHDFIDYSKTAGFKVAIVFLPVGTGEEHMLPLKEVIDSDDYLKDNIKYIYLNDYFMEHVGEEYKTSFFLVHDGCHLNEKGHAEVADVIYDKIDYLTAP